MAATNKAASEAVPEGYRVPSHGGGRLKPFKKSDVANPRGFGGQYQECMRLYRDASPAAARKMVELLESDDERVALVAAEKIMARAWGRVKDADPNVQDPEAAERRAKMRAEVIRMLEALAKPEPLVLIEEDGPCLPNARDSR